MYKSGKIGYFAVVVMKVASVAIYSENTFINENVYLKRMQ